jgi:hypothetical protein
MASDQSLGPDISARRPGPDRPIAGLISDLATDIGTLVSQEVALFKTEIGEKLSRAATGVGAIAAGALVAFSGWLALIAAAILGLAKVLAAWLAALAVGTVVIAIGAGLLWFAKRRLDAEALIPRRTLNSLRENEEWIREQTS